MSIVIRNANQKDFNDVVKIYRTEYKKYPYNENWTKERTVKRLRDYFKKHEIYVAESDKKIAGFIIIEILMWDNEDRGWIDELVVSSKFQGQGIGKKLMESAENYFKRKKIKTIILNANAKAKALKFYYKLNYKETDYLELIKKIK